jgi:hypothetical protein
MKKLMSIVLAASLFVSGTAMAECKWAEGIKKEADGYLYSPECHARVGVVVKDNDDLKVEVTNLRKSIELKDLALVKADERVMLWRNESYEQFERLQKQSELANRNQYLWFALGIVVTGAAVWGAGQLR